MSEVTFAKSFLTSIDKRQIKLPADSVSDPRKYPNQSPYILPKNSHPFPRKERPSASQASASQTVNATLKPMRSGETVTISNIELNSTIHDVKSQYASKTGQSIEKIKLLLNKKPAADLKTLKDLGVEGDVEFSVMIMGGAATPSGTTPATEKAEPVMPLGTNGGDPMDVDKQESAPESEKAHVEAAQGSSQADTADGILKTDEFWIDLKGFLTQRLRDEKEGERLVGVFRRAFQTG